jgi:hypothetical protein
VTRLCVCFAQLQTGFPENPLSYTKTKLILADLGIRSGRLLRGHFGADTGCGRVKPEKTSTSGHAPA